MSRKIHIDSVPQDRREQIMKDLTIKIEPSSYTFNAQPTYIYPVDVTETHGYIPFAYDRSFPRPERKSFSQIKAKFVGSLRNHQQPVRKEAISYLNKYGSVIVSCHPGWGKTCLAINIAARIGMKILILTHRIVLIKQWKEALKRFSPESTVQVLTTKSKMKDCDFYIMNPANVSKKHREFYKDIGTVIVDECHLIMSSVMSKSLTMLVPRYLIGLSATPYREDGLNMLLDLYFGKRKIVRELNRLHHAYKLNTGFTPDFELAKNGRVNWGSILDSQANDVKRNRMIVRLVKYFPDRVFLILCKRVAQGNYLVNTLKKENVDVTSLIGKQQEYEQKSRVLVGTTGKCSTGFDHPRLNTLILASDIQAYFIQVLGRIFRTEDGIPMVFDLVDNNAILERHYKVRQAVYFKHGGKVKHFKKEFPDFKIN